MTEPAAPPPTDEDTHQGMPSVDGVARACTYPGCTSLWTKKPGDSPNRQKCDRHVGVKVDNRVRRTQAAAQPSEPDIGKEWSIEEAISTPLSRGEQELADRIGVICNLLGGAVYQLNVVDGLLVGHHADAIAKGLVIEARTSPTVKKMVDGMATFAGSGPLTLTLMTMTMQIAANHRVPVIGTLAKVPPSVQADADRIKAARTARTDQAQHVRPDAVIPGNANGGAGFAECPQCGRRAVGQHGSTVTCVFCNIPVQVP